MVLAGPPRWSEEALAFCREIQRNLGLEPMEQPIDERVSTLSTPEQAEASVREQVPPWQRNYTSDDYVEYTWHAPTVRLIVGRCTLARPSPQHRYPAWADNALGGFAPAIDRTIEAAARAIAGTVLDLLTRPERLAAAGAEFEERTGGGIGGSRWVAPLLAADFAPPIGFRWPEYVTTARGEEWWIPGRA